MFDAQSIALASVVVFLAGAIRGYAGFGFAAIAITGLNLQWPPQTSVPLIILLDLIGTLGLLRSACASFSRSAASPLFVGAAFGLPIGLVILIVLPEAWLRILIGLAVLVLTLLLIRKTTSGTSSLAPVKRMRGFAFGCLSGLATTAASLGGLPVVYYFLSSGLSANVQRATLVIYLVSLEVISLILLALNGLITAALLTPFLVLLVPTLIGVLFGQTLFQRIQPKSFFPVAIPVLCLMSVGSVLSGVYRSL